MYQLINGFYGLSYMPATFQKTLDRPLENIHNKFNNLDDILTITKGSHSEHEAEIDRVLSRLDKGHLAIKLEKCDFARPNITWLVYKITQTGITPTVKNRFHTQLKTPKHPQTTALPHGIRPTTKKIYSQFGKPTRPHTAVTQKRKYI